MSKKQKLELTWIGKDVRSKLEPRILIEDIEKSYHAKHRVSDDDVFDNRLIFGDNLLALKALEQEFTGRVKCIYIDPPYNTGNAFEHYDDGLEHSIWLSFMRERLEILRNLLSDDGSIWISIDDGEQAYLKVICDEVFGRANFINNVIWEKKYSPQNDAKWLSDNHDFITVFAKNKTVWRPNLLPRTDEMDARYRNPDNDPRGVWKTSDLSVKTYNPNTDYPITVPSGRVVNPPAGRCWRTSRKKYDELLRDNCIWFGVKGDAIPQMKRFLTDVKQGRTSMTIWKYTEVGHNQDARKEVKEFNTDDVFSTPKPERLIKQIISLASNEGDLVLDSFAGSGTTGAVAHKMGRKWIMVELGEHCHTHVIPRMKKVIAGKDQGGISKIVNWEGGGGFRYYKIGPSLINKDSFGNPIINTELNPEMLAEAICKIEGFNYSPSVDYYWMHGKSTETDFIYITTQFMTKDMLTKIFDEVGQNRSLLVCCAAFRCNTDEFTTLTIKKIPKAILKKCEWSHDDYSLEVGNLPGAPMEDVDNKDTEQSELFGEGDTK